MYISKATGFTLILSLLIFFVLSCSSTSGSEKGPSQSGPEWLRIPPISSESIFGIGVAINENSAKTMALINAAQQFSTHVKSTMVLEENTDLGEMGTVLTSFDEQMTEYTVTGAKFKEKYTDEKQQVWILAEAPLRCLLDGTESILISHMLAVEGFDHKEETEAPEEDLHGYRQDMRKRLVSQVEKILDQDAMLESISSSGYVDPGFLVIYNDNGAVKGRPPVDKVLYKNRDLILIEKDESLGGNNGKKMTGWNTLPDGTGDFYLQDSILRLDGKDIVLYAQYEDYSRERISYTPEEKTITVDGKMDDWIGVQSIYSDRLNDLKEKERADADMASLYFAMDSESFYIMARTANLPFPQKDISIHFNLFNRAHGSTAYFDLFAENSRSISAVINYIRGVDDSWRNWPAMKSKMEVASGDVLEIALPLDLFRESPAFNDEMDLYFKLYQRSNRNEIDSAKFILEFPQN